MMVMMPDGDDDVDDDGNDEDDEGNEGYTIVKNIYCLCYRFEQLM